MSIFDKDAENALHYIKNNADAYAKAKAQRDYLDEFLRSKRAILMGQSEEKTVAMKECAAFAHPEYLALLEALRDANEQAEALRWKIVAAQTQIDCWRTQESTKRAGM